MIETSEDVEGKFDFSSNVYDKSLFIDLKEKALMFKDCEDPLIVSEILISILEALEICKFDKRAQVGEVQLLRGRLSNKNFLIQVEEE